MDESWNLEKYKSLLKKAYFSDNGVLLKDSAAVDDFFVFFKKYQSHLSKKGIILDKKIAEEGPVPHHMTLNSLRLPQHYSKYYKQSVEFNLGKHERYILREVPKYIITEFEYILHCYLEFLQRERTAKLKKLRKSQQSLPIFQFKDQILDTVKQNSIIILAGDTGCGKSTQVPQYLLSAGYDKIACTQPRRIACISLAKRVAFETLNQYGNEIAYQIRFERTKSATTRMLFLTEGLLLRQITGDSVLSMYNVIILDEVHERHLHGDFLLGILKELSKRRDDLKLILMSATINIELFSSYFDGKAPVLCVPGRLYPIQLHYRPLTEREEKSDRIDPTPYLRILQMIDTKYPTNERGDVLIFLSGIAEMTTIAEAVAPYADQAKRWIILMLHSTLSIEEQDKVFDIAPEGVRKCILSTNIAETSVTIDGVRFVIDSGKVKEMKYDSGSRLHRLQEIWVSKASAEQRKGRAGRTGPGICYRLYSEADYSKLDAYTTSEIHRVSLESLLLQMYHLGLPDPRKFRFLETPSIESVEQTINSLKDQNALSASEELTSLGRILVSLPVDASIGKMLVLGCLFRQVEAVLTMTAAVSVQSPFTSKSYRDIDCMNLRRELMSSHGDPFALLNVYREWLEIKQSNESTRKWCTKRGIEEQRLYEITKLRNQFKELLEQNELIEKIAFDISSTDRRLRYGELKRLKQLKRTFETQQRKPKMLKLDNYEAVDADKDETETRGFDRHLSDVHAVEFHMKHTAEDIQQRVKETELTYATVYLLKVIIASGLYPQYGILDPYNSYHCGSDQMLHTKTKPFVVLHPNSCLGQDPEVLRVQMDENDGSAVHQLIYYSMLLETTKPYVVNSVRLPALHSLLLYARSIDTNRDCSTIVCDQWIEFTVSDAATAQILLFEAVRIRLMLNESLQRKLDGDTYRSDVLAQKILEFLQIEVVYSMKRLLRADQNVLYTGSSSTSQAVSFPESLVKDFKLNSRSNEEKGGIDLTDFLTYGCLLEKGDSAVNAEHYLTVNWVCPVCNERFFITPPERLQHLKTCDNSTGNTQDADDESAKVKTDISPKNVPSSSSAPPNPLKVSYYCTECASEIFGTSVEILKHKRSHKSS